MPDPQSRILALVFSTFYFSTFCYFQPFVKQIVVYEFMKFYAYILSYYI